MGSTIALVAASEFNAAHFRSAMEAGLFDSVIAVDGGFAHLQAIGCVPDLAIGDFDSLGFEPSGVPCQAYPARKDKSDLELALDHALAEGAAEVYVYGAFGGRLDHTVANIQLLASYAEAGISVTAVGAAEIARYVVGPATLELPLCKEGIVSVFSLVAESHGVTERGLEYPLDDALLTDRTTWGLSNEFTGKPASVSVREGTLLVLCPLIP